MSNLVGKTATDYHDESWSSFVSLFLLVFGSVYLTYTPWATSYGAALRKKYVENRQVHTFWRFLGMVVYPIVALALFTLMFVATYHLNVSEEFQEGPLRTLVVSGRFNGLGETVNVTIPYPYATDTTYETRQNYNSWRTYQFVALVMLYASYTVMLRVPYNSNATASTRMITWSILLFLLVALFASIMAVVAIMRYPNYGDELNRTEGRKSNRATYGAAAWFVFLGFLGVSIVVHIASMFADVPSMDKWSGNIGARASGYEDEEEEKSNLLAAPSVNRRT